MQDSPAKQTAVNAIQEMGKWSPLQLDQSIHTFKSKFRAPIANRTWKFDLVIGALAPMRLRELFTELLASFIDPDKTIVIAVKRSMQPETEKKLWAMVSKKKSCGTCAALSFIVRREGRTRPALSTRSFCGTNFVLHKWCSVLSRRGHAGAPLLN